MRFKPVAFLVVVNVLLALGLAALWLDQHAQVRHLGWVAPVAIRSDVGAPTNAAQAGVASAGALVAFMTVLERPLFAPDRRPPPPPTPAPVSDPLANIQINGIFSGANAGIVARVDGNLRRVKVNETIGLWTLKSIEGRSITFMQGEESRKLHLAYAPLGVLSPAAGAASASASIRPALSVSGAPQNVQDETRERLRRRNEQRISRGLPLLTE